jgi:MFS transporter, DHA1 family, tetracycline resistance protein
MKFQKIIVFLGLLLDIIWIAILIPAFPELKAWYWINDLQVTLWLTIYSLGAFFSAPVLWQLSDKRWRKNLLAWCITGTIISYALLLVSQSYRLFLVSRIINGITWWNISILQAILTDISPDQETKSKNFWLMGAFFGLWFIIWPLLWSLLLSFSWVQWIFWFGVLFSTIELWLILLYFNNTNTPILSKEISFNAFDVMWKYLRKESMRSFLISLFFLWVGWFAISTALSLFMNTTFWTTWVMYWYILAISGLLSAFNLWLLIPKFWTKYFTTRQLIIWSHIALIVWYWILWFIDSYTPFILFYFSIVVLWWIYMPIYNIQIMSQAKLDEIGELSGMLGGAQSLFMFVGPLVWWLLLTYGGNIFWWAAVCFMLSWLVLFKWMTTSK